MTIQAIGYEMTPMPVMKDAISHTRRMAVTGADQTLASHRRAHADATIGANRRVVLNDFAAVIAVHSSTTSHKRVRNFKTKVPFIGLLDGSPSRRSVLFRSPKKTVGQLREPVHDQHLSKHAQSCGREHYEYFSAPSGKVAGRERVRRLTSIPFQRERSDDALHRAANQGRGRSGGLGQ
jgi:hypothetical protein